MDQRQLALLSLALVFVPGYMLGRYSPLEPVERKLVFKPETYPTGNWTPTDIAYEDVWFKSDDGTKLHGWYLPHPNPRAIALFCKGHSTNITYRTAILKELNQRHGLAVMTFDYRGYGRSEGVPHETGVMNDARAARAWLSRRSGQQIRSSMKLSAAASQHNGPAFCSSGKIMITRGFQEPLQLWDVPSGMPLGPPLCEDGSLNFHRFSKDGIYMICGSGEFPNDETILVPLPGSSEFEQQVARIEYLTKCTIGNEGVVRGLSYDDWLLRASNGNEALANGQTENRRR